MMRHKTTKIMTGVLSASILFAAVGCGEATTPQETTASTAVETTISTTTETATTTADTETTAESTETIEETVDYQTVDPDTSVENFITYLNESKICEGITKDDVSYTTVTLDSNMKLKKWSVANEVHLVDGHKVTSINEDIMFEGVVLEGYVGSEPISIYFTMNDKGKLANKEGLNLTSFLNTKQMQEF